jgi:hypothetical protein
VRHVSKPHVASGLLQLPRSDARGVCGARGWFVSRQGTAGLTSFQLKTPINMAATTYQTFDDLPKWAASRIRRFRPDDAEEWIFKRVPALDNQSFIEVMNQGEKGAFQARQYLNNVIGKFFC